MDIARTQFEMNNKLSRAWTAAATCLKATEASHWYTWTLITYSYTQPVFPQLFGIDTAFRISSLFSFLSLLPHLRCYASDIDDIRAGS